MLYLLLIALVPLASADSFQVDSAAYEEGSLGRGPTQQFSSSPHLPPQLNLLTPRTDDSSLCTFLGYRGSDATQLAPLIMDDRGSLVWTGPEYGSVLNVQAQTYQGEPVISFYTGTEMFPGYGRGQWRMLNSSYELIKTVEAQNTTANMTDPHDFQITKDDTAMVELWRLAETDLSSVGGPVEGFAWDCIIQEIDIVTDELLFEWRALDHVPVDETYYEITGDMGSWPKEPFDYGHLNSVQKDDAGNYLISMRGTSTLYYIEAETGNLLWRLGGKRSDFEMGHGTPFWFQHHARMLPSSERGVLRLSLFDNGANQYHQVSNESRALILSLDTDFMIASLAAEFLPSTHAVSNSEGSMQVLSNGNVVVGWGIRPHFSEYSPSGSLLHDVQFGATDSTVHSYRAFKSPWIGRPRSLPDFRVGEGRGWVSWNGATEVARWRVLGGERLGEVGEAERTGFETTLNLSEVVLGELVATAAYDHKGNCLGVSEVLFSANSTSTGVAGRCPPRWRKEEVRNLAALSLLAFVAVGWFFLRTGKDRANRGCWPFRSAEYARIPL